MGTKILKIIGTPVGEKEHDFVYLIDIIYGDSLYDFEKSNGCVVLLQYF